jgi:NAD(P)-dependent dehydrogenase (short-subunit alcohol dehydrogenase family)
MKIENSIALVTGANRGLGRTIVEALLARGARTVYAGVRNPDAADVHPGATPIRLDVTRPEDAATAARLAGDTTLLINNAGVARWGSVLQAPTLDDARAELETNLFGILHTTRAFAPVLAANGGGGIVNVLSILSWFSAPQLGAYSASKAAAWSVTNTIRQELHGQGTHVLAVHVGYMDTDMAAGVADAKLAPGRVAAMTLDALEAGQHELLADDNTRAVRQALSGDLRTLYPDLA